MQRDFQRKGATPKGFPAKIAKTKVIADQDKRFMKEWKLHE